MAGITVLQLACDGQPQLPTDTQRKLEATGSPQKMATTMEPAVVSVSPQGKGVGVFGLKGSPGMGGDNTDGPLNDPKVRTVPIVMHMKFVYNFVYTCSIFSFSLCPHLAKSLKACRAR